jgi:hypothetical protein
MIAIAPPDVGRWPACGGARPVERGTTRCESFGRTARVHLAQRMACQGIRKTGAPRPIPALKSLILLQNP